MRAAVVAAGVVLMATQLATSHAGAAPASPATLSPAATAVACAARLASPPAGSVPRVAGAVDTAVKAVFGPGDVLVIDTGGQSVAVGQTWYARRPFRAAQYSGPSSRWLDEAVRTSGWIRVQTVTGTKAVASVVHACDTVEAGDYLEPFEAPAVPAAMPQGAPDFERGLTVLFDNDERAVGSPVKTLLVERRAEVDASPGQRVTLFRRLHGEGGPVAELGHGMVLAVQERALVVRVDDARDGVYFMGDLAALHRR